MTPTNPHPPAYKIGQRVNFTTSTFGGERDTKENKEIKRIDTQEDGTIRYRIGGIGELLFGRPLEGDEDLYTVTEENITEATN